MDNRRLAKLSIQGFKSIAKLEDFELRPINVLVGANGCGKSNFIQVFQLLRAATNRELKQYVTTKGGAERLLHFGPRVTKRARFHLDFAGGRNGYELSLAPTEEGELFPFGEKVFYWDGAHPKPYDKDIYSNRFEAGIGMADDRIAAFVRGHLSSWNVYHFHDTSAESPLKREISIDDNGCLRADGANLAAFLYRLSQKEPERLALIEATVRRAAPYFHRFELAPLALRPGFIRLKWRHEGSEDLFDVTDFSDGTLRFIALATLFLQPLETRPSIIIIDEPELGLHPFALSLLAAMVQSIAEDTQVILATQSSSLLNHFSPEHVIVAERRNNATEFKRPSPDELESWLEDYRLGELWERNHFGGRPHAEKL